MKLIEILLDSYLEHSMFADDDDEEFRSDFCRSQALDRLFSDFQRRYLSTLLQGKELTIKLSESSDEYVFHNFPETIHTLCLGVYENDGLG